MLMVPIVINYSSVFHHRLAIVTGLECRFLKNGVRVFGCSCHWFQPDRYSTHKIRQRHAKIRAAVALDIYREYEDVQELTTL